MRIHQGRIADSGGLLYAIVALVVMWLLNSAEAQIQINIVQPTQGATASGKLYVQVNVSSAFELASVTAQVEGAQTNLKYSQSLNAWTNSVSLTGLPFGPKTLVITAQDFFGATAQAQRGFRVDNPPTLAVTEPLNGTVAKGSIYLSATASDDDTDTIIKVYLPTTPSQFPAVIGTNKVSGFFPVSTFAGGAGATFEAIDSGGNKTMIMRQIVLEPSTNLIEVITAPGFLFDFTFDRLLYSVQADVVLSASPVLAPWPFGRPEPRILHRQTGEMVSSRPFLEPWIDGNLDVNHPSFIASGALGTTGTLLWTSNLIANVEPSLIGWTETNANLSLGSPLSWGDSNNSIKIVGTTTPVVARGSSVRLILQDIVQRNLKHEIVFPRETPFAADLGPNQDLVYAVSNHVYRSRPASPAEPYVDRNTSELASYADGTSLHIVTDGTNVVYDVQVFNPLAIKIQLITSTGEETLATWPNFAGPAFRARNGWVAFTKPGTSSQTQVWTRSPMGTQQQRTFFGASSTLESIGPNGEVTFLFNGARYVSLPGVVQAQWVNSGQGRIQWHDGKLLVILGRSVLEFRLGQLGCTALPDGSTRLTFTGPSGLSYTVQASLDLAHWNDLWTFTHTTGSISWTNPPASAHNFYRAVTAPQP